MTESQRWKTRGIGCVVALAAFLVLRTYFPASNVAAYAIVGGSATRVTVAPQAMRPPIPPVPMSVRGAIPPMQQSKLQVGTAARVTSISGDPPDQQDAQPTSVTATAVPSAMPFPPASGGAADLGS